MTTDAPMSTSAPVARFGLIDVTVALQLQACPGGATAVARSGLHPDGRRGVNIWLNPDHLLVTRALHRADALVIRFVAALALVEYCDFWRSSSDGRAVYRALKRMAGIPSHEHAYGSGFASKLAAAEALRVVDTLPIFSKSPQVGPFDLFVLVIEARSPSDIRNWRLRDDEVESVRPISPKTLVKPPIPATAALVPSVDPFLAAFHARSRELLGADDYAMLEGLAKEDVVRGEG